MMGTQILSHTLTYFSFLKFKSNQNAQTENQWQKLEGEIDCLEGGVMGNQRWTHSGKRI